MDTIATNFLAYTLPIAENIDYDESQSYKEVVQSKEAENN
jgi:hypothetical protein